MNGKLKHYAGGHFSSSGQHFLGEAAKASPPSFAFSHSLVIALQLLEDGKKFWEDFLKDTNISNVVVDIFGWWFFPLSRKFLT